MVPDKERRVSNDEILGRLDERTETLVDDVTTIKRDFKHLGKHYVTQPEFKPVKALVYGFAGLIFLAVVGAMIAHTVG
jgi:hypothetical protein